MFTHINDLQLKENCTYPTVRYRQRHNTFGKHSKPPPVTFSKAKDRTLSGTVAANLQAIIAPVATR